METKSKSTVNGGNGHRAALLEGTHAVAEAVKLARVKVIASYPITPSTTIIEKLADMVGSGELNAKYINVESENSSISSLVGASMAGARTFTATSSHGLLYMHEVLHWASGARLPIVISNTNRSLGTPWSILADQTDSLSQRDTGWIQFYCESNQEIFDTILQSYRIAEQVYLPVLVNMDAFLSTHVLENILIPEQDLVDSYLPSFSPAIKIDPEKPAAFGGLAGGDYYYELKYKLEEDMLRTLEIAQKADDEFGEIFGRKYGIVECYLCDDAEILLTATNTAAGTTRVVVDELRGEGIKVGLMKFRLMRPFPTKVIRKIVKGKRKIAVIDRNISHGVGGIFAQELRSCLYNADFHPPIFGFVTGLGGKDITPQHMKDVVNFTLNNDYPEKDVYWIDVDL